MNLRILVIDKDPVICKALVIGLSSREWTVDSASDNDCGIENVNEHHYDLLIADIERSDGNGLALLKKIRQRLPDIIILVLTGQSCIDILAEDFLQEVNGFYPKPIGLALIKKAIRIECIKKEANGNNDSYNQSPPFIPIAKAKIYH